MVYNIRTRKLNGERLSEWQADILNILVKMNGQPIPTAEIIEEIRVKRGLKSTKDGIRTYIYRLNEKCKRSDKEQRLVWLLHR
jgi:DNA-binding response OmpR family regulator